MLHGVSINGLNTLTEYGLLLCADLIIGEPKLKENYVDIPGGNGSLNLSYSPQGYAVYEDRTITFKLFKAMGEDERNRLVTTLRNAWHGQEIDLVLPNDLTHYWHGVIQFGEIGGYNYGEIPVTMRAAPYKLKTSVTSVSGTGAVTLSNERMPVVPTVTATEAVTLAWSGYSVAISPGTQKIPQLVLQQGDTVVTVSGGSVTFEYREGSL